MQTYWKDAVKNPVTQPVHLSATPSGYINQSKFAAYKRIFIDFLKGRGLLGGGQKHLVLLDGHSSYLFNLEYMTLMKEHDVAVACLPPIQLTSSNP